MKFFPVPFTDCRTFCLKLLQAGRKERRVVKARLLMALLPLFSLTGHCNMCIQAASRYSVPFPAFRLFPDPFEISGCKEKMLCYVANDEAIWGWEYDKKAAKTKRRYSKLLDIPIGLAFRYSTCGWGVHCETGHVTEIEEIVSMGVMMTPVLALNGKIVCSGRVLSVEEIEKILMHPCLPA